jgi:hypothetical protein
MSPASVLGCDAPTPREYQQRAAECLEHARAVIDPTNKALLLEMAQGWIKLAEQLKAKSE